MVAIPIKQVGVLPLTSVGTGLGPCAGSWLWLPVLTVFSVQQGNLYFKLLSERFKTSPSFRHYPSFISLIT